MQDTFSQIRRNIRTASRDEYALLWSDADLDGIIDEAQREYAIHSGCLIGSFELVSKCGSIAAPEDFLEVIRATDCTGRELPIVSWKQLHRRYSNFRDITGSRPEALCFDFDGYGYFRIFPKIPAGEKIGRVTYRRLPVPGEIETTNLDAVNWHALYQVFTFSGKPAAGKYYSAFLQAVNREASGNLTLRNQPRARRGRFF